MTKLEHKEAKCLTQIHRVRAGTQTSHPFMLNPLLCFIFFPPTLHLTLWANKACGLYQFYYRIKEDLKKREIPLRTKEMKP